MNDFSARRRDSAVTALTLFAASGTLICCALPIVLVGLGLGSAVVALTGALPWLIALSQHKTWVFAGSAAMLVLAGTLLFRAGRACPADPGLARLCRRVDAWNRRIYWIAVALWGVGFAAAYLLLPATRLLDRLP
ncbi:MAG: hypothetical protein VYC42_16140 [Pseudomonadota bacterium]|nr:hypothetical protein [Nevskiales bacterium]MEC9364748.1 hypothetical protein [Pseudomonadota bacterium]